MARNWLIVLLLAILVTGCSGNTITAYQAMPDVPANVREGLPPVPVDKAPSAEFTLEVEGSSTVSRSEGANDFGSGLALPAAAGELEWGMWRISLPDSERITPVQLNIECGLLGGEKLYVAIGHIASRSWQFFAEVTPDSPNASFDIPAEGYLSVVDRLYVAACAYDGSSGLVSKLRLVTDSDTYYELVEDEITTWSSSITTSLAVVAGFPAIAFDNGGSLWFARARDPQGVGWNAPVLVYETGDEQNTGGAATLAVVEGQPAIVFYDSPSTSPMYVRALSSSGEFWGEPVTIDSSENNCGGWSSLAVVDGMPGVCYTDHDNDDLMYVRAVDIFGNAWGTPVVVDSDGDVGRRCSMTIVAGNPAIAYERYTLAEMNILKYVRAADSTGSAWETPVEIPIAWNIDGLTALVVADGNPAIAYLHGTHDTLDFIRATDAVGNSWGLAVTVVDNGRLGTNTSMKIIDGVPSICYMDTLYEDLMFIQATDGAGTGWDDPLRIDLRASTGHAASLAVVDGRPAMSYYNADFGELMFARIAE